MLVAQSKAIINFNFAFDRATIFCKGRILMKCNFKKKIQEKQTRPDFMTAFNRAFIDGDFKDLIAPETMNESLLQLLKD